jgi:hypothetical protein
MGFKMQKIAVYIQPGKGFEFHTEDFNHGYVTGSCSVSGPNAGSDANQAFFNCRDGPNSAGLDNNREELKMKIISGAVVIVILLVVIVPTALATTKGFWTANNTAVAPFLNKT